MEKPRIVIKRSVEAPPEVKKNPFYDPEIWGRATSPEDIYLPESDEGIPFAIAAHEIGHLLLEHTCNKNQDDGSHNETEANIFASELLVPTSFIKKDYTKMQNIQTLSKMYRVSDQALSIKMIELRLF